jgi:hypothetical protein
MVGPEAPKVLWFEAHANLAALFLPAPLMAGYGAQQIVRTLPEFCFCWLALLGVGLAIAFAIQALAHMPAPLAVRVPPVFMALKSLATPVEPSQSRPRAAVTQLRHLP